MRMKLSIVRCLYNNGSACLSLGKLSFYSVSADGTTKFYPFKQEHNSQRICDDIDEATKHRKTARKVNTSCEGTNDGYSRNKRIVLPNS
jgi:hypothetical protein